MQILLLFYSGHGCLLKGKPCAVGVDGKAVNLYSKFAQALNRPRAHADSRRKQRKPSTHSIVLLMDASLNPSGQNSRPAGNTATAHKRSRSEATETKNPITKSVAARPQLPVDTDEQTANLVVCAHACQPGEHAYFELRGSIWTDALLQSMRQKDDLMTILMHASNQVQKEAEKQEPWVSWNKRGSKIRCSLARCAVESNFATCPHSVPSYPSDQQQISIWHMSLS